MTWAVTLGGSGHVAGLAMLEELGFKARAVTYDGGGPVRIAILGEQVDFILTNIDGAEAIADQTTVLGVFSVFSVM